MAKPKCKNCKGEMIEAFTKVGLKILLCPSTKVESLDKNNLHRGCAIYCEGTKKP